MFLEFLKGILNWSTLDGVRFVRYTAERIASPQYSRGTFMSNRDARTISNSCLFFLSAIPFCWGVPAHEVW